MSRMFYYIKRLFRLDLKSFFKTVNKISKRSGKSKIIIFFDIILSSFLFGSGYVDYDLFNFENVSYKKRKTFITRSVNNEYVKKLNNREFYNIFDDKELFNQKFSEFIGRDFLNLEKCSYEEFTKFVKKHNKFVAKPLNGTGGKGIEIITINKNNVKNVYEELLINKQILLEEVINQSNYISDIYPNSVNTLRIVTLLVNGETHIVARILRIGNKGNVVDNFHKDGMYTTLDDNGNVLKPAVDREGNIYENHPQTNASIIKFKIKDFEKVKDLIIKASKVVPEVGYVGWDIAITDNGPILIEGNHLPGYDLYQSKIHLDSDGNGKKIEFDKIIYGEKNK